MSMLNKKTIEDIGTNLPGVVVESAYYIENNKLIITKGKKGVKIDTEKLLQKLKEKLKQIGAQMFPTELEADCYFRFSDR